MADALTAGIGKSAGVDAAQWGYDNQRVNNATRLPKRISPEEIDRVATDFESVFLSQMLEHMFEGIETDATFGGGHAEDIYRSMMVDEYGKIIAKSGGIGVADHVRGEILRMQGLQDPSQQSLRTAPAAAAYAGNIKLTKEAAHGQNH